MNFIPYFHPVFHFRSVPRCLHCHDVKRTLTSVSMMTGVSITLWVVARMQHLVFNPFVRCVTFTGRLCAASDCKGKAGTTTALTGPFAGDWAVCRPLQSSTTPDVAMTCRMALKLSKRAPLGTHTPLGKRAPVADLQVAAERCVATWTNSAQLLFRQKQPVGLSPDPSVCTAVMDFAAFATLHHGDVSCYCTLTAACRIDSRYRAMALCRASAEHQRRQPAGLWRRVCVTCRVQ